ncbi:MAG: hypothetical protein NC924_09555, partial [Candidatus Omnitrophica bacterium]|nr:hypothetical protein [Candidatus Omnitrophota bacterium]
CPQALNMATADDTDGKNRSIFAIHSRVFIGLYAGELFRNSPNLYKPFAPKQLLETIEKIFSEHSICTPS